MTSHGTVDINLQLEPGLTPVVTSTGNVTAEWFPPPRDYFPGFLRVTATASGSGSAAVIVGSSVGKVEVLAQPMSATTVDFHRGGACALAVDRSAWCWGGNASGQIGSVTTKQCNGGACQYGGWNGNATPLRVDGAMKFSQVQTVGFPCRKTQEPDQDCGATCALTADGDAWCWGLKPMPVIGLRFKSLAVRVVYYVLTDYAAFCGIALDDKAYCTSKSGPVQGFADVGDGKSFRSLSGARYHMCGVELDGDAYCWGNNARGVLGNGTADDTEHATPELVAGGLKFSDVRAGTFTSCARETTGAIYCWGSPTGDKCSSSLSSCQLTPVVVAQGHKYVQFARGELTTMCGLTDSGSAECWNGFTGTPWPAPVPVALTSVSVGAPGTNPGAQFSYFACGVGVDNIVYCWNQTKSSAIGR